MICDCSRYLGYFRTHSESMIHMFCITLRSLSYLYVRRINFLLIFDVFLTFVRFNFGFKMLFLSFSFTLTRFLSRTQTRARTLTHTLCDSLSADLQCGNLIQSWSAFYSAVFFFNFFFFCQFCCYSIVIYWSVYASYDDWRC